MNNTIQKSLAQQSQNSGKKSIQVYIKQMAPEIKKALPSVMTPERFTRIVLSALSVTPKLGNCTPQSFLGAMMTAAQLGLEPNTPLGQAYLIPYYDSKKKAYCCQFQLGYRGLLELAYRSGQVNIIQAQIVYSNDEFDFRYGLEPKLTHKPCKGERGQAEYVYAMFRTTDGGTGFEVMSITDIRDFAKRKSKAYEEGPWQTDFEEMAKKTVLKHLLKYAPLKSDFVKAVVQDETVKTEITEDMYTVPEADIVINEDGETEYPADNQNIQA